MKEGTFKNPKHRSCCSGVRGAPGRPHSIWPGRGRRVCERFTAPGLSCGPGPDCSSTNRRLRTRPSSRPPGYNRLAPRCASVAGDARGDWTRPRSKLACSLSQEARQRGRSSPPSSHLEQLMGTHRHGALARIEFTANERLGRKPGQRASRSFSQTEFAGHPEAAKGTTDLVIPQRREVFAGEGTAQDKLGKRRCTTN